MMIKNLLLTAVFALGGMTGISVHAANLTTHPDTEMAPDGWPTAHYQTPKTHGQFKFKLDPQGGILIRQPADSVAAMTLEQVRKEAHNYSKAYVSLQTPQQKAKYAYDFVLRLAEVAGVTIRVARPLQKGKYLSLTIYRNSQSFAK